MARTARNCITFSLHAARARRLRPGAGRRGAARAYRRPRPPSDRRGADHHRPGQQRRSTCRQYPVAQSTSASIHHRFEPVRVHPDRRRRRLCKQHRFDGEGVRDQHGTQQQRASHIDLYALSRLPSALRWERCPSPPWWIPRSRKKRPLRWCWLLATSLMASTCDDETFTVTLSSTSNATPATSSRATRSPAARMRGSS